MQIRVFNTHLLAFAIWFQMHILYLSLKISKNRKRRLFFQKNANRFVHVNYFSYLCSEKVKRKKAR